jgi:2-keto-4-pentenoate hydratase/2-oxohepta-3-ene-1,7-dioic acid hydratase in catechol pathway
MSADHWDERPSKILCIGRNYAEHAAEMGANVPAKPIVFLKPPSALIGNGDAVILPEQSSDVHHEVELVALIGRRGKHIPADDAVLFVAGYAVGIDLTARDIQSEAKKAGQPWSVAKGFDTFAPLGIFTAADKILNPQDLRIQLRINGALRQDGWTGDMLFSVHRLVAYCSSIFTLEPGDLLYTGTPKGVGPVRAGDILEASATGLDTLSVTVR